MKRIGRKLVAALLCCALAVQLLPMTVLAAARDVGDDYNEQVMAMLEDVCDSEEDAQRYYAMLEEYGFMDEDGNAIDSWSITMDGQAVTLEEIRELLADPFCDKTQIVTVDGTPVTLEDLETMIAIEDYLAYLEETYFSDQLWTEEELANLEDLVNQINTEGIEVVDAEDEGETGTWSPSVNHDVRLDVKVYKDGTEIIDNSTLIYPGDELTVKVTPSEAQTQDITFTWRTVNGSATADRSWNISRVASAEEPNDGDIPEMEDLTADEVRELLKEDDCDLSQILYLDGEEITLGELAEIIDANEWTATIPAGSTDPVELNIVVGEAQGQMMLSGNAKTESYVPFLVQIYNVVNALFTDGTTRWEDEVMVYISSAMIYEETVYLASLSQTGQCSVYGETSNNSLTGSTEGDQTSYTVSASFRPNEHLEGEEFAVELNFDLVFSRRYSTLADDPQARLIWDDAQYDNSTVTTPITLTTTVEGNTKESKEGTVSLAGSGSNNVSYTQTFYETGGSELWDGSTTYNIEIRVDQGEYTDPNQIYIEYWGETTTSNYCYVLPNLSGTVTATFYDTTTTTTATVSAPEGTYYPGQSIPITVTYNYPMRLRNTTGQSVTNKYIEVNGTSLYPEEKTTANGLILSNYVITEVCTFLYPVSELDEATISLTSGEEGYSLGGTGGNSQSVSVSLDTSNLEDGVTIKGVDIQTPDKSSAIDDVRLEIVNATTDPVLNVMVDIVNDEKMTAWLTNELFDNFDEETGTYYTSTLTVLYDGVKYPLYTDAGSITGGTLTAQIPIDVNTTGEAVTRGVELLVDGAVDMTYYATTTQAPAVFLTEEDIDAQITVTQTDGSPYTYLDDSYTIWAQDQVNISASVSLASGTEWSFGGTSKTTILTTDENGDYALANDTADFVWWIGDAEGNPDNSVANITAAGLISPTGSAGTAYVYLTALNGDNKVSDEGGRAVTVTAYQLVTLTDEEDAANDAEEAEGEETEEETGPVKVPYLRFDVGLTPFLYIPYDEVTTVAGQDLTVYWTSNLCDKNVDEETEEEFDTYFYAVVTCGDEEVYRETLTGTASSPASGVTIPGTVLTYDYSNPDNNVYELTVSSEFEDIWYVATATITLQPNPAVVTLETLDTYYVADDVGSVTFNWTVDSFDYYGGENSGQFDLQITRGDGEFVDAVSSPGTGDGKGGYSGSYTLEIDGVTATPDDATSYREIYTVTIAAKNGSDSTWSYDSFLLYVYDREALDIWINGEPSDGVTLSNVKAISEMTQDEILALNRDIYLKAMISVNYGEYAWAELTDQMKWESSDSKTAPVTYQQGTLYENIEHFSYTSYRPTTDFGITGLKDTEEDGYVTITATHALTGISDSVTVDVERLDEQLFLFQCYPQTTTTLTYTNGDGEEKTITSDGDGAAAVYEESGIATDIYCQSTYEGDLYIGTIYNQNLKSGEGDWTQLERYPCNNLTLHRAAYAYMYLKNPDGTPYTGDITIRAGVYVDGNYIKDAYFDYNGEQDYDATWEGYEPYTLTLGSDGKLTVTMDQTQWGFSNYEVNLWNNIYYIFDIEMGEDQTELYPMIVTIDATVNETAYVGSGEAVVTFRENPTEGKHPFIVGQMAYHGGIMESVLDGTGSVGPSEGFPEAQLYTMLMWWGEDDVSDDASGQIFTSDGTAICTYDEAYGDDQKYDLSQTDYPFSDKHITTYSLRFDEESLGDLLEPGESTGLYLEYYKDGSALTRREDLTFSLVNMIGIEEVTASADVLAQVQNLGNAVGTEGSDPDSGNLSGKDKYLQVAMNFMSDTEYTDGRDDLLSMQLAPTSDPTKFLAFMAVNVGGLEMDDQVKVGDEEEDGYYDGFGQVQYATSVSEGDDWDYWPGYDEIKTLAGKKSVTDYFADAKENVAKGESGKTTDDHDLSYSLGGYMEALIYYDYNAGSWKMQMLSGGFHVGGGYEWAWNFNTWVGPVPFTATLKVGAEAQVSMDALTAAYTVYDTSSMGTDILTELRVYLYLYFFAGVGFDYSVLAFKLGVYGQIDVDMEFEWLKRNYLDEDGAVPVTNTNTDSTLKGQHYTIGGEVGLELVVKFLFVKYDKVLFSYSFNLLNQGKHDWDDIQDVWDSDKDAYNAMIKELIADNSISVYDVGGTEMMTLNLAATREDVSYLSSGSTWGSGIRTMSLDETSGLQSLNKNAYEFADPVVTEDGQIVAFLGVPASYGITGEGGISSSDVSAMFATKSGDSYTLAGVIADPEAVLSDSQPSDGTDTGADTSEPEGSETGTDESTTDGSDGEVSDEPGTAGDIGDTNTPDDTEMPDDTGTGENENEDSESEGYEIESEAEIGDYGDSELTIAGTGSFAVAAWTQQTVDIAKDDGAVLTEEDQRMMMDGTDICVSVWDGSDWTTARIENGGADMAPVVATNGNRAIVAWRSVATSDAGEITDFDQKDTILYKIYDGETVEWSETRTLYNGTNGNVKGITAEMLSNGTAAVAYAIDTDDNSETYTDREIVYAVIDNTNGEVIRNVRATNDDVLDENPQLTTVTIGKEERFLLGWYTEQSEVVYTEDGEEQASTTSDIRFIDFDADGNATQLMPDSLNAAATGANVSITSDFAFTKGKGSMDINDLSIVWTERTVSNDYIEHDVMKAVKFYTNNGQITYTGAVDLAEMPEGTLVDSFDAYTTNGTTIKAVIMGTTYGKDGKTEVRESETEGGKLVSYEVPATETNMYTATEKYENTIDVPGFMPDYEMLKLGAKTQIMFDIENDGIDPITSLTITVGGQSTTFTGLNLLPGDNTQLYADYVVPIDGVQDETFTVTAPFSDGSAYKFGESEDEDNIIYLNLPDIQITDASIIREEDGERDILIKLNNTSDAALGDSSGTSVRLSFYSDATYESPIEALPAIEITPDTEKGTADLKMIDEGGYSTVVTFDVADYLANSYGELTEIPETGVNVYIQAEVIDEAAVDEETGAYTREAQGEPNMSNNYDMVTCENLQVRTGQDVTITSTLDIDEDGSIRVKVDLQNTRLTTTETGNVIVTLLGEDGSILAQQQSYNEEEGWLTLYGEEKATKSFTFEGITEAFTVDVQYLDMILDASASAELDTLTFPNLGVTLDDFILDEDTGDYVAEVKTDTLWQTSVIAIAQDANATIAVNGKETESYYLAENLDLTPGKDNVITVTVTNGSGVETNYVLTIHNETVTVTGSVIWDDDGDRDGIRPENIMIRLWADGEPALDRYGDEITATVTAGDDWSYSFTNLPIYAEDGEKIVYTITENTVDGYSTVVEDYDVTNSYTPSTVTVSGSKTWVDNDDQDGYRPKEITVRLWADGVEIDSAVVTAADDWSWTFTDLPQYCNGGTEIVYVVTEDTIGQYMTEYDGFEIINTHSADQTSVTVVVAWDDDGDRDGIRPNEVTVQLLADGEAVDGATLTLSAENRWLGVFTVDIYRDGGQTIDYTVEAVDPSEGYTVTITGDATTGYVVTQTHEIATVDLAGTVTWDDNDNQDGIRPDSVTIHIRADGEIVESVEVTGEEKSGLLSRVASLFTGGDDANTWAWSITDLPKYRDGGIEIEYTITEEPIDGYETAIDGYDVTNSHIPETITVAGTITWDDADDQDGIRPDSVTVHLYADGKEIDSLTVTAENGWRWSFADLAKYRDGGIEIVYTITVDDVEEYEAIVDNTDVTFTHTLRSESVATNDSSRIVLVTMILVICAAAVVAVAVVTVTRRRRSGGNGGKRMQS